VARTKDIDYSKGVAITSSIYPDEHTHIEPVRFPAGSDVMYLIGTHLASGGNPLIRILNWLWYVIRHPLVHLKSLWPTGWATRTIILLTMQTVDNSIRFYLRRRRLPPFRKKMEIRSEEGRQRAPVNIEVAHRVSRMLAERIDGYTRGSVGEMMLNLGSTAHILGGCIIGPDTRHGVIDGRHRVFGYDNMLVVDGSAVPANLGVNPSLTITAMAEHAMSHVPPKNE
jgi:cholesterol oxidase